MTTALAVCTIFFLFNNEAPGDKLLSTEINTPVKLPLRSEENAMVYMAPINTSVTGKPFFDINVTLLQREVGMMPLTMDKSTVQNLVLVTALSNVFFSSLKVLVSTVQDHLPGTKLIVYDMGLDAGNVKLVSAAT